MILSAGNPSSQPIRCLSIDVEDYFHIEAAYRTIPRDAWDRQPPRVERNVAVLLDLFYRHNRRGTFFVLGYVAKRFPQAVKRIAAAGHEIASHGTGHDRLHRLNADTFRADLLESRKVLEDLTGKAVIGYRAPTFSVVPQTAWAIDVLLESGFAYDSSIFPVRHHWYGVPDAPTSPFFVRGPTGRELLEIPPLTWCCLGRNIPVAGGGYFRLLPLGFMKRGLAQAARQGRPAVLYFHPWEFDPKQPRMALPLTGRIRTYTGLKRAVPRLESIMRMPGQWTPIAEALQTFHAMATAERRYSLSPA